MAEYSCFVHIVMAKLLSLIYAGWDDASVYHFILALFDDMDRKEKVTAPLGLVPVEHGCLLCSMQSHTLVSRLILS